MLMIFWNFVVEIPIDAFELIICFVLIALFLDFKKNKLRNIALFLLGHLVILIAETALPQYFMISFINVVYTTFFIYPIYKGRLSHKVFVFSIVSSINYTSEMFIIAFTNMGFNSNLFKETIGNDNASWITICKFILYLMAYLLLKHFASDRTLKIDILSSSQALILSALPAFGYATIVLLDYGVRKYITVPIQTSLFLLIVSFGTLIYNVLVMILIDKLILNKKYKYLNEMSQEQLNMQFNHYQQIVEKNEQTRKLKHDMKNHLTCMRSLIENNEIETAKRLLDEINADTEGLDLPISSGNNITDAILNEKYKLAEPHEIKFEFSGALPNYNFINPLDISTIFSNALDNAIEAAQKCEKSQRFVKISVCAQGKCLFISFENSVYKDIVISGESIATSKIDREMHGFGLKNIKESVLKYGGTLNINCVNKVFSLDILLNMIKK